MTFYITPIGRMSRRRMWAQPRQEEHNPEVEAQVYVPVNLKAEEDAYVITALLPGVNADDLAIQVVNDTITLQGEVKDSADESDTYLIRERPFGNFYRVIRLPEPLNAGKAEADLTDGVLTLRVPKTEEARPRTIKVNAGR